MNWKERNRLLFIQQLEDTAKNPSKDWRQTALLLSAAATRLKSGRCEHATSQ